MTTAIDFIRESAMYMVEERPDVYDQETAVEELSTAIDSLREGENPVECIMFTSFVLIRVDDGDGMEEFLLTRKVSGMLRHDEEEGVRAYSYSYELDTLPNIMDLDSDEDD